MNQNVIMFSIAEGCISIYQLHFSVQFLLGCAFGGILINKFRVLLFDVLFIVLEPNEN
jgi:hypothetical protein